jgi:hypothetical protein
VSQITRSRFGSGIRGKTATEVVLPSTRRSFGRDEFPCSRKRSGMRESSLSIARFATGAFNLRAGVPRNP